MELIVTRGAWGKWMRSQRGHPQSDLSKFGLHFLQCFCGVRWEIRAGTSCALLVFLLYRWQIICCLAPGVWGRQPGVSLLEGRGVRVESSQPRLYFSLARSRWSYHLSRVQSYCGCSLCWMCAGILLFGRRKWSLLDCRL